MKRLISVKCWWFLLFLFLLINNGNAQEIILDTSFEDTAVGVLPDGFRIKYNGKGNQYQIVTNVKAFSGTHSLQVWGIPNWQSHIYYDFDVFAQKYVEVSLKMFVTEENNGAVGFVNENGDTWGWKYCTIELARNHGKLSICGHGISGCEYYDSTKIPLKINGWNDLKFILNTETSECQVFLNNKKIKETQIDFDSGKQSYTYYFIDGTRKSWIGGLNNPNAYYQIHGIIMLDSSDSWDVDEPTYFDDIKIVEYNSSHTENGSYEDGFEAGKEWCRTHPSECGIEMPECPPCEKEVAVYDIISNTLTIPNFQNQYWLKFKIINTNPIQLELKSYGSLENFTPVERK